MAKRLFSFPNPVNEVAARLVAGGVVVMAAAELVTHQRWLLVVLAYGFWARVLTGPTLSPLGQLVTRGIVPRLRVDARLVPGPPKRFAQGIGATLTTIALVAWLSGALGFSDVLIAMLVVAATLESVFALCLGCKLFALLIRVRVIPEAVCLECADITTRLDARTS